MHENKYLHLPVVDEQSGEVVGVVNVMEIIQATAGDKGSERLVDWLLEAKRRGGICCAFERMVYMEGSLLASVGIQFKAMVSRSMCEELMSTSAPRVSSPECDILLDNM